MSQSRSIVTIVNPSMAVRMIDKEADEILFTEDAHYAKSGNSSETLTKSGFSTKTFELKNDGDQSTDLLVDKRATFHLWRDRNRIIASAQHAPKSTEWESVVLDADEPVKTVGNKDENEGIRPVPHFSGELYRGDK
ncbi:hypothetical protein I302_101739 [Kwoniella bestiolae CBS 10118]|uniref:Uncharacterized protein n=1 Tax=Kwoniella bestiolae CBS 10118 TaxID=1296100 RepID=A0A1B9GD29_9TREE|nr:hypothetical protein I302_00415 [Kwoniella bestiolae CBS 10118]OCF28925.1 hypothetical protein I302_00415 [Kwoniella bestiolae CBS 10118]